MSGIGDSRSSLLFLRDLFRRHIREKKIPEVGNMTEPLKAIGLDNVIIQFLVVI